MKTHVILISFCLAAMYLGFYVLSNQKDGPKEVVVRFFNELSENNIESVKRLVMNEPDYVYRKAFSDGNNNETSVGILDSSSVTKNTSSKLTSDELVKTIIPSLYFTQKRFLSEVVKSSENENEAKVRVSVGSIGLADIQYDVLLYKADADWKIFAIRNVKNPSEDDPYDFYANDQQ